MGKIRVKALGIEELEEQEKKKEKVKKEQKQARKTAKGAHGGERVVSMAPSEEELAKLEVPREEEVSQVPQGELTRDTRGTRKPRGTRPRERGRRYREALTLLDRNRTYPLPEAVELLKKIGFARFDGAVELHINTLEKGVSGQVVLPHGTGKKIRVAIADNKLVADIEKGQIDFDILLAHPKEMAKLAKVAKILGPRGLMPNPKSGTISDHPDKLAEKYQAGQMHFRTEAQTPIIHLVVGKVSMKDQDLSENIQMVINAIGPGKIKNITLKSTMSPGIKISIS